MPGFWVKFIGLMLVGLCTALPLKAEELTSASPDGRIVLKGNDSGGLATYSIAYDGGEAVGASRLGILFRDHHGFERDLAIISSAAATNDQTWEQPWGERRIVRDNHNELAVTFASQEGSERQMAADLS